MQAWDWLYLLIAWTIAASATLLTAWAWFWDRPRGKRRCPKCWYDMSGTPGLRCPECGREFRHERRLLKTRRRKRWVVLAALLALFAYAVGSVPRIRSRGWTGAVPSTALVFIAPATTPPGKAARAIVIGRGRRPGAAMPIAAPLSPPTDLLGEVWNRLHQDQLSRWQSQIYISRLFQRSKTNIATTVRLPERWPLDTSLVLIHSPLPLPSLIPFVRHHADTRPDGPFDRLPPVKSPTTELRLDIGYRTEQTVYSVTRRFPIVIEGTRKAFLVGLDSPEANMQVRNALAPYLTERNGRSFVIVRDRDDQNPAWRAIDFGLAFTIEVRVNGEVQLDTFGKSRWLSPHLSGYPWHENMLKVQVRPGDSVVLTLRGTHEHASDDYLQWPFNKPQAACWTGEFTMPLQLQQHPSALQQQGEVRLEDLRDAFRGLNTLVGNN